MFGFPFLHAVLPHSPLHVKCLADTEERVENGYVRDIVVRVRETRLTNLFSNILIGISMLFLGYVLEYIPTAVLDGLFLYLALTALYGNQVREGLQSHKNSFCRIPFRINLPNIPKKFHFMMPIVAILIADV